MDKVGTIRPEFKRKLDNANGVLYGKNDVLFMPNNERRKVRFAVVPMDEIIASHNELTFGSSKGYPTNKDGSNLNDRNYSGDRSAQAAVQLYAEDLQPERLIQASRTEEGTPIISLDGFVVSGNNRTMSIKRAARLHKDKYEDYRKFLVEDAMSFGIDPGAMQSYLDKTEKPILVRIDHNFPEYKTLELSKYNKDPKKARLRLRRKRKKKNLTVKDSSLQANDKTIEITLYEVLGQTEDETFTIYEGISKKDALQEFEFANRSDIEYNDAGGTIELAKGSFVFEFIDDPNEIQDYPIADYWNDSSVYEIVNGDFEIIQQKEIPPANEQSDVLLFEVEDHYRKKYAAPNRYSGYYDINIEAENGDYIGCVQLRISDHTQNIRNIDRFGSCDYYISVVIADQDPTKERFAQMNELERRANEIELRFDSDDTFNHVISSVDTQIHKGISYVKNKAE